MNGARKISNFHALFTEFFTSDAILEARKATEEKRELFLF